MSPTRRTVLRAAGLLTAGALAGCTATGRDAPEESVDEPDDPDDGDESLPNGSADPAGGTRPAGTGGPGVSLRAVDDAPPLPVKPSVGVVDPTATDERPPRLRVTVENASDERVRVGEGRTIFFQYVSDDSRSLVLLPADGEYPAEPGCWRLSEGIATTLEYRTLALDPGESRSELLDLYAAPDEETDACLPVGEFRFEAGYAAKPVPSNATQSGGAGAPTSDGEGASESEGGATPRGAGTPAAGDESAGRTQARWGFSLALE